MLSNVFWVVIWAFVVGKTFGFEQNDYNLTSERMEVAEYNKTLMVAKIHNFKYNRTHTGVNATFDIKKPLTNLEIEIQAFRFASNEYRLFPINFKVKVCDVLQSNEFGLRNVYHCGNFSGCPIRKGYYEICNWAPDGTKFPPHIPSGPEVCTSTLARCRCSMVHED